MSSTTVSEMPFGKHKGVAIAEIADKHPRYIKWLYATMAADPESQAQYPELYEALKESFVAINAKIKAIMSQ